MESHFEKWGSILLMKPCKPKSHAAADVARKRTITAENLKCFKHRSKFAALTTLMAYIAAE
jgi:hypothetical protein